FPAGEGAFERAAHIGGGELDRTLLIIHGPGGGVGFRRGGFLCGGGGRVACRCGRGGEGEAGDDGEDGDGAAEGDEAAASVGGRAGCAAEEAGRHAGDEAVLVDEVV